MTREQAKKLLPAIQHFANGGNLWCYDIDKKEWFILNDHELNWDIPNKACYIIEDKHFEARKAFALGEEIEVQIYSRREWDTCTEEPGWFENHEYRPKLKEPTYVYQFTFKRDQTWHMSTGYYQGLKEAMHFITGEDLERFEPSRKERK